MNKTLFFAIILLAVFVVACTPAEQAAETTTTEQPTEEQPAAATEENTTPATGTTTTTTNASAPACVDSDGGLNTNFAGDVVDSTGQKYYDVCEGDGKTLNERKCGKDSKVATSKVICLNGCKDGSCVPNPQEEGSSTSSSTSGSTETQGNYTGSTAHCTDTDGGLTYDIKGTCSDSGSSGLADFCIGSDTLAEWSCSRLQDKCVQQTYACSCSAGSC